MALIKCKMCGGDMEISADKTFGTCEYCGSVMTLPKVSDEQRAAAFNRGNHFRRTGEFDKALSVYERIVAEDDSDAEAHWCCALCRFGIEYVEDPATFEWLPTCHRASFDSFLEDVDYLAAVEHSDGITRRQYQKDAAKIAEVQRGILATSQNEEPFDVFICYKESDENGQRTKDSILAQEIYYQLTEQGRRVFFARITLEDKGGAQYEPYIFAALNSAKVMIAVGTKPEHFGAVWVKNEWSRFLSLMKKDRSKLLLPCYRDMDPYDLPEALSVLQSYDMSKIGFIQDLIRGINKVLDAAEPKPAIRETVEVNQTGGANAAPLLKRAFLYLEDGDWKSADEYCERVLDMDPENAEAYLGKLMAERECGQHQELAEGSLPLDSNTHYAKVMRFGSAQLKTALQGYNNAILERNELARKEKVYQEALKHLNDVCIENVFNNRLTDSANTMLETKAISKLEGAIQLFEGIRDYQDSAKRILACEAKIAKIKEESHRLHLIWEQKQKEKQEAERKQIRRKRIFWWVYILLMAGLVIAGILLWPAYLYQQADQLAAAGKYKEASETLCVISGYKDSEELIMKYTLLASSVGDVIKFGHYEQNGNLSDGKEDIEWIILKKEDDRVMVISKYALDSQPYNSDPSDVTWETCTLREWLNRTFLSEAFSEKERAWIPTVTLPADTNSG